MTMIECDEVICADMSQVALLKLVNSYNSQHAFQQLPEKKTGVQVQLNSNVYTEATWRSKTTTEAGIRLVQGSVGAAGID